MFMDNFYQTIEGRLFKIFIGSTIKTELNQNIKPAIEEMIRYS